MQGIGRDVVTLRVVPSDGPLLSDPTLSRSTTVEVSCCERAPVASPETMTTSVSSRRRTVSRSVYRGQSWSLLCRRSRWVGSAAVLPCRAGAATTDVDELRSRRRGDGRSSAVHQTPPGPAMVGSARHPSCRARSVRIARKLQQPVRVPPLLPISSPWVNPGEGGDHGDVVQRCDQC